MKSFFLLVISLFSLFSVQAASLSHEEARNCYQAYLDRYIQEHDDEDYLYTLSSLQKEEAQKMFLECKVKDEYVVGEMLKVAIAYDFQAPISYDYQQAEEVAVQQSTYSNLAAIYGRFSSENGVNINFPTFKEYQRSETNRIIGMTLTELRGKTAETYQYLVDQSRVFQKFSDQQLEVLLDNLLFQFSSEEACQSYCSLLFQEIRKMLVGHPQTLLHLSNNYSRNKYIWLNINNDYYTSSETLISPFTGEGFMDVNKKKLVSIKPGGIPLDPKCDTEYLISAELFKVQQRAFYLFLITDKCGNKIKIKSVPNKFFSLKLEMKSSEEQLLYTQVFTGNKLTDVVKMIREILRSK